MDLHTPSSIKRRCAKEGSRDAIDEDRISKLPDDLILYILSFLQTKDSIPTGALSKRWKNMWKKVEDLSFCEQDVSHGFADHVTDTLLSYQNPSFSSLNISVSKECDPMNLIFWLKIAFTKKVSKLVLRLNQVDEAVTFPDCLLRRANSLKILKLMGNINLNLIFVNVFLGSLKELHLYYVKFENESSVTRLLSGCPVLQDLVLNIHISSGVTILIINVPSLLRLTISTYNCQGENIMIQTPCLRYLNIRNFDGVESCVMWNAPDLIEATISRHSKDLDENILLATTSVQCLSLAPPLKTPSNTFFYALASLKIDTEPDGWCSILSYMLTHSPKLQLLKLVGGRFKHCVATWVEPQFVAHCLLTNLHTIQWEDYVWDGEDDIAVAIYLLKNAEQLKNATFTTLEPSTETLRQQKQSILNRIANSEQSSPSCRLLLENSSSSKSKSTKDDRPGKDVDDAMIDMETFYKHSAGNSKFER